VSDHATPVDGAPDPRERLYASAYELARFLRHVEGFGASGEGGLPGCLGVALTTRKLFVQLDHGGTLMRDFDARWDALHDRSPDVYRRVLADPAITEVPMPGVPDSDRVHLQANVLAVRYLLYLEGLLRVVDTNPRFAASVGDVALERDAPERAIAGKFVRARLSVRDPRGEVERRIRASESTPGSTSVLRWDGW
jgi:hypothetical protein